DRGRYQIGGSALVGQVIGKLAMVKAEMHLYLLTQNLIEGGSVSHAAVIDVHGFVALVDDGELQLGMLQRIQFERGFSALRARSHGAAERIEETFRSVDV